MITGIKKKNKLTEIWFDETGSAVNIRTYNTDLKNRLTAYAAKYPAHCRLTDDNECGCLTFEIDRRRFSVRLTAPYSEDRRSKAKETMTAVNQRRQKDNLKKPLWPRDAVHRNNKHRRRPTKSGIVSPFSGLLYCADCGEKLYYSVTNNYKREQAYFFCSSYRKNSEICSAHYIREKVVEQIVLESMQRILLNVQAFEKEFAPQADGLLHGGQEEAACRQAPGAGQSEETHCGNRRSDSENL